MSEWEKVGVVGVDAGMIWIGDPCYVLHTEEPPEETLGKDWGEFCERLSDSNYGPKQWNFSAGHAGLGVTVPSGFGDGCYEVFVKRKDMGEYGKRIAEVKIVFIDEEDNYASVAG